MPTDRNDVDDVKCHVFKILTNFKCGRTASLTLVRICQDYFDIMNFRNSICGPTRSHQLTLPCNIRDGKRWDLPLRGLLVLNAGGLRPIVTPMPNSTPIPSLPPIPPSNPATQVVQVVVVEKFLKDKDMQNHDCLGQSMNGTTYRGCVPVSAASVVAKKATKCHTGLAPRHS